MTDFERIWEKIYVLLRVRVIVRFEEKKKWRISPDERFLFIHNSMWCRTEKYREGIRRKLHRIENWTAFTLHHSNQTLRNVEDMRSIFNHTIIFHLYCYCLSILFFTLSSFTKDVFLDFSKLSIVWLVQTSSTTNHISMVL